MEHTGISHYLSSGEFYRQVQNTLKGLKLGDKAVGLITLDFDNFNYVNDLFSYQIGDLLLTKVTKHFSACLNDGEIFSKVHADHFVFCLRVNDCQDAAKLFEKLTSFQDVFDGILPEHYTIVASGGIIVINDNTVSLSTLQDRANFARKRAKGKTVSSYLCYDDVIGEELKWQKDVTCSMEAALKNNEFEMYLQPKVLMKTHEVIGAEALVRWNSSSYGFVFPDKFIPIMEQNGFIRQLDFFMLKQACDFLNKSKDYGIPVLPISVNFSKAHISTKNLVEKIHKIVEEKGVPTSLIEIEFTENIFADNLEKLIDIVKGLKRLGFKVSLDDFGSAYSSLNCLKDLPVDIIKIDKGFLSASTNTEIGKVVITKIVEMIKSLRMISVMEGIETSDHVEFLQKLSCDLGQGYFYSKPMAARDYVNYIIKGCTVADVYKYLKGNPNKKYLNEVPQEFQMDSWELYTLGKNIHVGLMKGYLDGGATVQYINDKALSILGYTRQEFRDVLKNSILSFTHPDDVMEVTRNTEQLIKTGNTFEFATRAIRKDGKVIVLSGNSSCIIDNRGRPVGIYSFSQVDEYDGKIIDINQELKEKVAKLKEAVELEKKSKRELIVSEDRYRLMVEGCDYIMFDWDFKSDSLFVSDGFKALFLRNPITKNVSTDPEFSKHVHPKERDKFNRWVAATYKGSVKNEVQCRIKDAAGAYHWLNIRSTPVFDAQGFPFRAVGVMTNISDQKYKIDELTNISQRDSLTQVLNKGETDRQINSAIYGSTVQSGAMFIVDIDNFKGLNDNLGHQLGDTVLLKVAEKVKCIFRESDIIGRIGGDELAIFMKDSDEAAACRKAEELAVALRMSYYGSDSKYDISGSIGIALYPDHASNYEDLYHFADVAMYEAKNSGKDQFVVYKENIESSVINSRTPAKWSEKFLDNYFQNDFNFRIFNMLYESTNIKDTINNIVEILGVQYQIDRVYIFQANEDGRFMSNTYEWCKSGIQAEIHNLQGLQKSDFSMYFNQYSSEGVFCCPDIRLADKTVYNICEPQGIKSVLHSAILENGEISGILGFDTCTQYRQWTGEEIAIIAYTARILAAYLNQNKPK